MEQHNTGNATIDTTLWATYGVCAVLGYTAPTFDAKTLFYAIGAVGGLLGIAHKIWTWRNEVIDRQKK